jgi:DNA repair protein RecO (recombination protein O)
MPRSARSTAPLSAYVLHRWDWSETSLILDLFTREQGRLAVAAKGAKRPYSQLRPVLLPFQRLHVSLGRAMADESAEVQTLRAAEWAGGRPMLAGDALFSGFYLNELLMKLLVRQDPHPALFDAYAGSLPALAAGADFAQAALRAFELVLLRDTGLLPELGVASATLEPVVAAGAYTLRPEAGVVPANASEAAVGGDVLLALQAALDAGRLDALQAACAQALAPLRSVLRALLYYHLGSAQPLRTRQAMVDLQSLLE